ncbi:lytic transglycosylase domain-containing protein [Flexithrix dorotheae]|uniref:lytic transglycosylase domain-containing protein n=1 Tax=Flexithrix dorotheae TaxID=70993 RepID=UPI00036E03F8|nr:lytic transglycosylase domain-containing protein [Flexithrix dorotheae]
MLIKYFIPFIFLFSVVNIAYSQEVLDSSYTVEMPEGYILPWIEDDEVVTALNISEEATERVLNFDTTAAIGLEEIVYDRDFIPSVSDELIKDRLSCIENEIPLNYHERVRLFIDFFSVRKRDFTLRILQRKNIYFPLFEEKLKEHGLPDELKYLSIIESALIPHAKSRATAVGLWQFMSYTGKVYGLKQSYYVDERMDPEKSTEAACKYLKYLYEYYNDWELAIAAYNCGPGNVNKAKRRTGKFHFWDIYERLPRETRSYLPQFVAMMYVLKYAEEHNLIQDKPFYEIPSEEIFVNQSVDLRKLAKELNVCEDDLFLLNPKFKYKMVPEGVKNYPVKIPSARVGMYLENQKDILANVKVTTKPNPTYASNRSTPKTGKYFYTVKRGDVLGTIAQRNGVRLSDLRNWNNIYSNKIYPGQKLVIYGKGSKPPANSITASNAPAKPVLNSGSTTKVNPAGKFHTVKSGETLWGISQQYEGMTVEKIKKLNNLKSSKLKIGQKLKLG